MTAYDPRNGQLVFSRYRGTGPAGIGAILGNQKRGHTTVRERGFPFERRLHPITENWAYNDPWVFLKELMACNMTNLFAWTDDLIFFSRIHGVAAKLGLSAKQVRTAEALLAEANVSLVLVDLQVAGEQLEAVAKVLLSKGVRLVGYGSHVDAKSLRLAREWGLDPVLARSQFVERLPVDLFGWMGQGCCS